jgi:hypothetical protein
MNQFWVTISSKEPPNSFEQRNPRMLRGGARIRSIAGIPTLLVIQLRQQIASYLSLSTHR